MILLNELFGMNIQLSQRNTRHQMQRTHNSSERVACAHDFVIHGETNAFDQSTQNYSKLEPHANEYLGTLHNQLP